MKLRIARKILLQSHERALPQGLLNRACRRLNRSLSRRRRFNFYRPLRPLTRALWRRLDKDGRP